MSGVLVSVGLQVFVSSVCRVQLVSDTILGGGEARVLDASSPLALVFLTKSQSYLDIPRFFTNVLYIVFTMYYF